MSSHRRTNRWTAPKIYFVSITGLTYLLIAIVLLMPASCRSTGDGATIDRHNPEAVVRAYFAAWNRNDISAQKSFMVSSYANANWYMEPVDTVTVVSVQLLDEKIARLWSEGDAKTTRVYLIVFDYKPRGRGLSMERGRYTWTYVLTWDAGRDSWLVSNYGAG